MTTGPDKEQTAKELGRVAGQISDIASMVADGTPRETILERIATAGEALHGIGQKVLQDHIRHCLAEGLKNGNAEEALRQLAKSVALYTDS